MERQLPKNVRQIGNVSDEPKIYVEDYVDTYINQLREKAKDEPVGFALAGQIFQVEETPVVYIEGAFRLQEVRVEAKEIGVREETVRQMEEDRKTYFPESDIVGWGLVEDAKPMGRIREAGRVHNRYFSKDHSVFIWKDSLDGEEMFYAFKYGELMQMGGHYIFYEKNPAMQNYMITTRKKIGVSPSEVVEDRAAKDFRSTVRERMEKRNDRLSSRMVYLTSTLLVVVVLVIGALAMNSYDKMAAVQSSLESLSRSVGGTGVGGEDIEETEDGAVVTAAARGQEADGSGGGDGSVDSGGDAAAAGADSGPEIPQGDDAGETGLTEDDYYVVQKGDTLDTISRKVYGNSSQAEAICKMNGLSDGNLIYIGQKLLLP
ncbi:LysM domain-containing protein [uncultured Merdimonas sp.]|uniref:LysM peptidoglycan-binding domain-containing protein n=1 Tax=uncultured Merdimonas sp. TaxID=2023269 RepID=UPI003208263A